MHDLCGKAMCMRNLIYMLGVGGAVLLGDPPGLSPMTVHLGLLTKSLWAGQHGGPSQERDPSITIPTPLFLLSETEREVLLLFFFFFFNFLACGILVAPPRTELTPAAVAVCSLNHWTAKSPCDSAVVF